MTRKQELKKEAAAWRKLAEWCATHYGFLCGVTGEWANAWAVPPFHADWWAMHRDVTAMATAATDTEGLWNNTALASPMANEDARVMFCLLMALECEAEAKEVPRRKH